MGHGGSYDQHYTGHHTLLRPTPQRPLYGGSILRASRQLYAAAPELRIPGLWPTLDYRFPQRASLNRCSGDRDQIGKSSLRLSRRPARLFIEWLANSIELNILNMSAGKMIQLKSSVRRRLFFSKSYDRIHVTGSPCRDDHSTECDDG